MNGWPGPKPAVDEISYVLPSDGEGLQRWQEALDALHHAAEAALGLPGNLPASAAGAHTITNWTPPADLGPLPESLQERARNIAALQQRAVELLATSRADVEREMAELTRPRRHVQPVYMDVTG